MPEKNNKEISETSSLKKVSWMNSLKQILKCPSLVVSSCQVMHKGNRLKVKNGVCNYEVLVNKENFNIISVKEI